VRESKTDNRERIEIRLLPSESSCASYICMFKGASIPASGGMENGFERDGSVYRPYSANVLPILMKC